eukprot:gnl/TRDRNA2_/TRDRNA2_41447_c0_seq1.p1 gnl/TRDRNA2_/TRDRNA2_41447_c0~~gnl/TRDRNA2_/TRDRNA2_41447_c0_seq1.p1  ORF type:complete len:121 (+),score=36.67 gnl/TRDRNA2_/TRDRNA2_41447_c0_seq1:45-407(+)
MVAKIKSSTAKAKGGLDLGSIEKVLAKWHAAKKAQDAASKEIESCKTQVEATMAKTGQTVITTSSFSVDKRKQSRESVSVKDLPADIRAKYAKTSEFTVLTLKEIGGKAKGANPKAKGKK